MILPAAWREMLRRRFKRWQVASEAEAAPRHDRRAPGGEKDEVLLLFYPICSSSMAGKGQLSPRGQSGWKISGLS